MLTQTVRHMEHDGLITNYDVILVLGSILIAILLRQIVIGGAAAGTYQPATTLVSAKAGVLTEHRTDAVEQKPASDHACCRRGGRTQKRPARTKGRAHASCQTGTLLGISWLWSIGWS